MNGLKEIHLLQPVAMREGRMESVFRVSPESVVEAMQFGMRISSGTHWVLLPWSQIRNITGTHDKPVTPKRPRGRPRKREKEESSVPQRSEGVREEALPSTG